MTVVETHMSWVFIAGDLVYKLKKPVRFPYLDFSTCDRREAACRAELAINQRLAPHVYLRVVPLTAGREGMAIFKDSKSKPTRIPTFAQEVYDVSGAGDTVISVLALSMAAGSKLEEAAFISNLAAGVEVSKRGTATVSQKEIVQAYLAHERG